MPLYIIRNDITKMKVDAIVNAANQSLLGGGGVDGCIHRAAGPKLLEECRKLGGCETGQAVLTRGYKLSCKYVIHAVGPRWVDGNHHERELLVSCYKNSLDLTRRAKCKSVAFPLISSGIYGYPKAEALRVAVDTIGEYLNEFELNVYLVIFDRESYQLGEGLYHDIEAYIDDNYTAPVEAAQLYRRAENLPCSGADSEQKDVDPAGKIDSKSPMRLSSAAPKKAVDSDISRRWAALPKTLDEALKQLDESFSEMLIRKIDERGMTDAQCYKKANIDRKLFSKIRGDRKYKPSKPTVIAFAIALELPLDELRDMLMKAGFALSHSSKFDVIIEFFVERGNYNIYEINEALFAFDQCLLGG